MRHKTAITSMFVACLALLASSCASYTGQTSDPNDPNRTRNNALIGAGIGAVAGLLSGSSATERRQHAMIGAGIGVVRDGDVIKLNLPDGVTFDFNRTELKPQFFPALNNVAATLREYNQTIVEVSGHTDNVGSEAVNQRISEQRAQNVASYLIGQGLQRERFEVVGMGERYPIASNDSEQGRALNRRVEIRLLPLQG